MRKCEQWTCENCGDVSTGEPAHKIKRKGHEGQIELWFCENCVVENEP